MLPGFAYVDRIVEMTGAEPSVVKEVLRLSYGQNALFHGVKENNRADEIKRIGMKPFTRNGTPTEWFWTKGLSLFIDPNYKPGSMGETIDCSLTNYSATRQDDTYDPNSGLVRSCLVVTDYDNLRKFGVKNLKDYSEHRPDGQTIVFGGVPAEALDVIDVTLDVSPVENPRERGRLRERTLVNALYETLRTYPEQGRGRVITRSETGIYVVKPLLRVA